MDVFTAVADPVRRALLGTLGIHPARVVDLAAEHPISRPAISKHLRVLTAAGLTDVADVGRERHYRLRPAGLAPLQEWLDELLAAGRAAPTPPIAEHLLDGLDLEVRRTVRDTPTADVRSPAIDAAEERTA